MVKARLTSKGQITLPKKVRERMGVKPGDEIEFIEEESQFRIRRAVDFQAWLAKWSGYLGHLEGQDPDQLVEEMRGR